MRLEKFVYNTITLQYEKVEVSLKKKLLKIFGLFSASSVYAAIMLVIFYNVFDSPKEIRLKREMGQMKHEFQLMSEEVTNLSSSLQYLHNKDRNIYRVILEAEPVDDGIWNAGTGGRDRYEHLKNLSQSQLLIETASKISKLERQMVAQNKSYAEIMDLAKNKEKMLASIPSIIPVKKTALKGGGDIGVLSGFGYRMHPIYKIMKMHAGIDFTSPQGTPIQATGDGVVVKIQQENSGYGNSITISHGYGYETLYGHMSAIEVSVGEKVKRGQTIGKVGSTGASTGPHLHYEVHKDGNPIDPKQFCMDGLSPQEYQKFVNNASVPTQSFD